MWGVREGGLHHVHALMCVEQRILVTDSTTDTIERTCHLVGSANMEAILEGNIKQTRKKHMTNHVRLHARMRVC